MRLEHLQFAAEATLDRPSENVPTLANATWVWDLGSTSGDVIGLHHVDRDRLRDAARAVQAFFAQPPHQRQHLSIDGHRVAWAKATFRGASSIESWQRPVDSTEPWRRESKVSNSPSLSATYHPQPSATPFVWDFTQVDDTAARVVADLLPHITDHQDGILIDEQGRAMDRATYEGWLSEAAQLKHELEDIELQRVKIHEDWDRLDRLDEQDRQSIRDRLHAARAALTEATEKLDAKKRELSQVNELEIAIRQQLDSCEVPRESVNVPSTSIDVDGLWRQVKACDRRLAGWQNAKERIEKAIEAARSELTSVSMEGDPLVNESLVHLRDSLRDFEKIAEQLVEYHDEAQASRPDSSSLPEPGTLKQHCGSLYHHFHTLHERLCQQDAQLAKRAVTLKLRHLRRLEKEADRQLEATTAHRQTLLQHLQMAGAKPAPESAWVEEPVQEFTAHVRSFDRKYRTVLNWEHRHQKLGELQELNRRYRELKIEIEELEQQVSDRRADCKAIETELAQWTCASSSQRDSDELKRLSLLSEERTERYQWVLKLIASFESAKQLWRATSNERNGHWLARLTQQRWTRYAIDPGRRELAFADDDGPWVSWRQLDTTERRLACLGIALESIAQTPKEQPVFPAVVFLPEFVGLPAAAGQCLRDASHQGQQVWLFTSDSVNEFVQAACASTTSWPTWEPRRATVNRQPELHTSRVVLHRANNSDAEEFPGEFRDQVVADAQVESPTATWAEAQSQEAYDTTDGLNSVEPSRWIESWLPETPATPTRDSRPFAQRPIQGTEGVPASLSIGLLRHDVATWGQLAEADLAPLLVLWDDEGRETRELESWHAVAVLLCKGGVKTVFDARVLAACGIQHPREIATINGYDLFERIRRLRDDARGRAILACGSDEELAKLCSWVKSLEHSQPLATFGYRDTTSTRTETRVVSKEGSNKTVRFDSEHSSNGQPRSHRSSSPTDPSQYRFYANLEDDVVDAPSIGPKMAGYMKELGVETIQDFLEVDPEHLAELLEQPRVDEEKLIAWQLQTELVCRVPNLRGHDAQILVACEVTTAEELAEWDAEALFEIVEPFAASKAGQRILRAGRVPDLAEVTDWIHWAQHTRPLKAA